MLSTGAFNALLKTLEEPPAHAVFLLATTEPHRIPATILSRCQRYDFRRITNESIVKRLAFIASKQNIAIENDALSAIATIGDGALRDSVSLLDQVSTTSNGKLITRDDILRITGVVDESFLLKFASALLEGRAADLLPLCRELTMDGRDLIRFTLDLAQYFRNILVTQVSSAPQTLIESTSEAIANMRALGQRTDTSVILFFISRLSDLVNELKWSPSARTSFEIMMLRLASRGNKIIPAVVAPVAPAVETEPTPVKVEEPEEKPVVVADVKPVEETPVSAPATEVVVEAKPVVDEKKEDTPLPPPVVDELMAPPPVPDMDFMAPPPAEPPMPDDADAPADIPEVPEIPVPSVEELSRTQPVHPNLQKAFSSEHVNEGQRTNLAQAARVPDVRTPQIPNDILMPEDVQAPVTESAPVSNLQQVIRHGNGDTCETARKEFLEYLKVEHTFEYMYMGDCQLLWHDQTAWCIMPDSFSSSIEEIRSNGIILTQLLKISQKYEPALIHVQVVTRKEYETSASRGKLAEDASAPSRPDWVKAVEKVSEENGIPLTHVKDL